MRRLCAGCCSADGSIVDAADAADDTRSLLSKGGGDAAFVHDVDLIELGFECAPPAVLQGVAGPASGHVFEVGADEWRTRHWQLDERLSSICSSTADLEIATGCSLTCENGSFFAAGLTP